MKTRNDASLLCALVAIAILSAIFAPPESVQKAEPPPVEGIRIGDIADVAEVDPVKDVKAPEGYYRKTKGGWAFIPEAAVNDGKPPMEMFANFVNARFAESAAGLAVIVIPLILIIRAKGHKKRKANERDMKRISGVSQAEFQALIRKLSGMEQILQNLLPENGQKQNGGKRDGFKYS